MKNNADVNVLVIDGQGGKIGRQLVNTIQKNFSECVLTAVGTNSVATAAMLKGTQIKGATGENAVIANARRADVIIGPVGIVIADALMGEISPAMAVAVGQSEAVKILLPVNKCENLVAGISDMPINDMINDAMQKLAGVIAN
ncbi:MAG: DUF3842 family protein [Clostridium sp.]|nr:DUF3842 family protein [Clostridium sp.]